MGRRRKWECWQPMTKWQLAIVGVLKKHVENTMGIKLDMILFFFQAINDIQTWGAKGVGKNVERHHKK